MISVLLIGAAGRMGREVVRALYNDAETQLVSAIGSSRTAGQDVGEMIGLGTLGVEIETDLGAALERRFVSGIGPDVVVDFSVPAAVMDNARACANRNIPLVIGATGLSELNLQEINERGIGMGLPILVAPNFAIGAILMMRFASEAAKYFEMAEILEFHHEKKLDAPSGTAFQTATKMRESRGADFERVGGSDVSRGGEIGGISVHSIRLPGFLAHQEVVFGMPGQTLSIRHDTITRECYMPGVLLAIKRVRDLEPGLHFGLEQVM